MFKPTRLHILVLALAILGADLLSACDKQIYTDDELKTQQRFRSIKIGASEEGLIASLGPPMGVTTPTASEQLSFETNEGGVSRRISIDASDRSQWPRDLQFLPKRRVSGKVLVYADGTVTAYYFVDPDGRVEHVDLYTS